MRLHKNWNCKYCPATFSSRKKLWEHHKICEFCPRDSLGRVKHTSEEYKFSGKRLRENILSGKTIIVPRKHTASEKKKISESTRRFLKENNQKGGARFSIKACKFIDDLNSKMNWNLQHALNGGEITVGKYYLDGYDKKLNIAFEYDEKRHNRLSSIKQDKVKQEYIKTKLRCRFFRYSEVDNNLYEV